MKYHDTLLRSAMVVASIWMPTYGHAQSDSGYKDTSAPTQNQIEEIVVTAQKRAENLQSVPVAVTALDEQTITNARVTNIASLSSIAPNLTIDRASGGNGIPVITLRGMSGGSGILGVDNPVSLYVDGIILGEYFGAVQDVADLKRIEVLRGPQGTLFGRNSTGGAINFISTDPTGKFQIRQLASVGNFDSRRFKTRIDLDEFSGVRIQLNYLHLEEEGDVDNSGEGTVFDHSVVSGGRIGQLKASKGGVKRMALPSPRR